MPGAPKIDPGDPLGAQNRGPGLPKSEKFELAVKTWIRDHLGRALDGLLGPRLAIRVAIWAAGGPRRGPPRRDFESKINFSAKKIGLIAGMEKTWKIESILSEK